MLKKLGKLQILAMYIVQVKGIQVKFSDKVNKTCKNNVQLIIGRAL